VHGSQNNSLLFASLIWLLYVANYLTSAWLRWPRRWCHLSRSKARPLALVLVVAVVVGALIIDIWGSWAFCFGVRGLGVGMASKCIGHSLSLIKTRIVFVSSICRRNSPVSYWYSGLYCFRSAKAMRLTLMNGICRTFYMRNPFGSSIIPVPLTFCNLLLPI
jgi:hypothetical protein